MAKKKAIKLAAASAVAASAFVAAAPAQTDAASNVAVEVSKAVTQMKKAYHTYSDVTAQGKFAPIADVYKEYNAAKKAYANAKALVNKAGGADKDKHLAALEDTYAEYIAKRVITYIDAYNYATTLQDKQIALEEALKNKDWDAAEKQYHAISYELKTRTVILDRVYGKSTRELLRGSFKADAQAARDSIQNEVSVKIYFDKAEGLLNDGKLEEAKAAMDHVADYVAKLDKDTDFGAALLKKVEDAKKKLEELSVPKVESVSAINASQIKVTFNKPVLESDLINGAGALQNLSITAETVNGVASSNPGTLTPELSADGKTLTLTTAAGSKFDGTYTVELAKNTVKIVKDGSYVSQFEGTVVVKDTTRPTLTGVTYNAAGTVAYLAFSEPVSTLDGDFSITGVSRADGVALNAATTTNFTAADFANSATKRNVIEVSLADIDSADANKNININFVGVKDGAGNLITPNPVSVSVVKDTAVKAQASLASVKRASATTLELTFDKELQTAPSVEVNGGTATTATVTADPKVYEVTLTAAEQALTGIKNVVVNGWNAYNTSGAVSTPVTKIVDFTVEKTAPAITSTQLTKINNVNYLVVNFNEEVTLADLAGGTFTGTVSKPNGDLVAIPTVAFTAPTFHNQPLNATKSKAVKINLDTLTDGGAPYQFVPGTYNVKISAGIAKDAFLNSSAEKATSFTVTSSTAKLAAPTNVASKAGNPSVVVVTFADKVDVASAETVSNYSIEGATIQSAKVVTNSGSGATVELTIAAGTVSHEGVRLATVKNVKGFADSFAAMDNYSVIKTFTENVAPKLAGTTPVKLTSTSTIVVDFDEALVDASPGNDFDVYQNGVKVASTSALDGADTSKVIITLGTPVTSTSGLVVKAASTIDLEDAKHNGVIFSDTVVSN